MDKVAAVIVQAARGELALSHFDETNLKQVQGEMGATQYVAVKSEAALQRYRKALLALTDAYYEVVEIGGEAGISDIEALCSSESIATIRDAVRKLNLVGQ